MNCCLPTTVTGACDAARQIILMRSKIWVTIRASVPCHMSPDTNMKFQSLPPVQIYSQILSVCLSGSTPTTFTSVLPISLRRISTRRCRSRCSYSRGALRSTQCAPVCTTLLSTTPCQWVYPSCRAFVLNSPADQRTLATSKLTGGKTETEKGRERTDGVKSTLH